jgi:hypothetical protein
MEYYQINESKHKTPPNGGSYLYNMLKIGHLDVCWYTKGDQGVVLRGRLHGAFLM